MALDGAIQVGLDILKTTLDAVRGVILAQTGDVVKQTVDADDCEWWQHVGFSSCPSNPQAGKSACQGVVIKGSGGDVVIATRDARAASIYGNLGPGETCVWAAGPDGKSQGRVILKGDGSVNLLTTHNNQDPGVAVFFRVTPTEMRFDAPWGRMVFDAAGFRITTPSGAELRLGPVPGLPGGLTSRFSVGASIARIDSPAVLLGPRTVGKYVSVVTTILPSPGPLTLAGAMAATVSSSVKVAIG